MARRSPRQVRLTNIQIDANNERALVLEARRLGLSWAEIANAFGRSRQAVWERHHVADAATDHEAACTADTGWAYIQPSPFTYVFPSKEGIKRHIDLYVNRRQRWAKRDADYVAHRRQEGDSWGSIAADLGITKQAAWERYGGTGREVEGAAREPR